MKILYGLEPDFCIANPDLINTYSKDLVLPQYFYIQLKYLKDGSFSSATEAANKIFNSLITQEVSFLLMFKTNYNGTIYFINQQIVNLDKANLIAEKVDIESPFDRYLLILYQLTKVLEVKIVFLALSAQVINKCYALGFEVATPEEVFHAGESWLQPEILLEVQAKLDPLAQVQWLETSEQLVAQDNLINWLDITI